VANPLRQGKLVTLGLARECSGYQALPGVIDSRRSAGTRDISELRPVARQPLHSVAVEIPRSTTCSQQSLSQRLPTVWSTSA